MRATPITLGSLSHNALLIFSVYSYTILGLIWYILYITITAFFLTRSVECNSNLNTCSATAFIMIALINLAIKVVGVGRGVVGSVGRKILPRAVNAVTISCTLVDYKSF